MAKEYLFSLTEPKQEPESKEFTNTTENCDVSRTTQTNRMTGQPPSSPTRGQVMAETTRRGSKMQQTKDEAQIKLKEDSKATELQRDAETLATIKSCSKTHQPVHLKPLHVLQCHSKQDSSEDFSTQLWACAFPSLPDSTDTVQNI
ncbi:leucine-rich repeat and WD repeat-containing protein 1-like isoform X1 [Micropterus dolomieu]|uniref:leucine-rich repeat and WD repeat-containing protein 1-like isoform X1 n=1 Tax=Micropterus dolomieu TaxID=147949 RepID=UPI001E8EBD3F|nr:leucine-rich repeat and WD repeat-containing protein 1-like isoform X1 [Micropterus dolomieu]